MTSDKAKFQGEDKICTYHQTIQNQAYVKTLDSLYTTFPKFECPIVILFWMIKTKS